MTTSHPATPDGRYFVVKGRLWRLSNPDLAPADRERFIRELMTARRQVGAALKAGDQAKHALGERGPVWWTDGAPDYNRKLAANTPYAAWHAALKD